MPTPRTSDNTSRVGVSTRNSPSSTGSAGVTFRCDYCRRQWAQSAGRKWVRGMWKCADCVAKGKP